MSSKKQIQLGMNPSTASNRLVKDTLWRLVVQTNQDNCFQCGEKMTRDNFSVEHKVPWLDSEDPSGLFFDQDNISFSHHACNVRAGRNPRKKYESNAIGQKARDAVRIRPYCPVRRKNQYSRTGK